MSQLISPLTAALLATAYFIIADACVCYVGDEANSIKGEPPLKLLPDQNPCECTEFRPGGVNTKRQAKPREVTFGNDGHPQGWTDKDCIKETTPSHTTSPCGPWSFTTNEELNIPIYTFPVILEFTLHSSTDDLVRIIPYSNSIRICTVDLDAGSHQMGIRGSNATIQNFQDTFDGSTHYLVTINQDKMEFGRLGETKSLECHTNKDEYIDEITIRSESDMTVAFYGTCPDTGF
ncbi:uncharacterized protein [Asterias amurensis]|uniref:uncharacterized protein n=1 Tax=Asterias amurensis TaxID=7602 RepID=UPI003AB63F94